MKRSMGSCRNRFLSKKKHNCLIYAENEKYKILLESRGMKNELLEGSYLLVLQNRKGFRTLALISAEF